MSDLFNMQSLFTSRIFQIPNYQRGYAWEDQQLRELLEDLEQLPPGRDHFTGMVVIQATDGPPIVDAGGEEHTVFDVVDGQQRITTLLVLLDAIRREAAALGQLDTLAEGIAGRYLHITDAAGQRTTKVRFADGTQDYFERTILADKPSPVGAETPAQTRLAAAAEIFRAYIRDPGADGTKHGEWLLGLHNKVAHRLKLNIYEVEDAAEVGVIFEVMNNRGRPLSDLDLVKNYILYLGTKLDLPSHTLPDDVALAWNRVFTNLMSAGLGDSDHENQLLRSHWIVGYEHDTKKWQGRTSVKAMFALKKYSDDHEGLLTDLREFVHKLGDASVAYCDAHRPTRDDAFKTFAAQPGLRVAIIRASDCLIRLNVMAAFRPLLVATRLRYPTDAAKYLAVVQLCEIFAFRVYRWHEKRSNTGQSTLFWLANQLYAEELSFEEMMEEFAAALLYYSSDREFRGEFELPPDDEESDWYSWGGTKYFLFEYERSLAGQEDLAITWSAVQKADRQKTIEHVLPQTPDDPYWQSRFSKDQIERLTHDIGNLCLTHDNSSYGKKAFPAKRGKPGQTAPCYWNAELKSERQLAAYTDWGPDELLDRRKQLVEWAIKRWSLPAHLAGVSSGAAEPGDDEIISDETI
jgi:hypothetical protein